MFLGSFITRLIFNFFRFNYPVFHVNNPVEVTFMPFLMGNHDDGLVEILVQFFKKVENNSRILRIKVCAGFIGKEDRGFIYQCPCNRNALLFAAGHFTRQVMNPVSETYKA